MIDDLKKIEEQLEQVEKEKKESEWNWGFEQVLREYRGKDEVLDFDKMWDIANSEKESGFIANTKFPSLDSFTEGFREGNLVIVTGPTGQGKTSLLQTFTKNFSPEITSLWFSYEVPTKQFLAKFGESRPLSFMPKALIDNKLAWIERKIVEAIVKYGVKVIMIDHLHFLFDMVGRNNTSLEIGNLVRQIKKLALKYKVVIFLVSHLTKTSYDERIGLEDIRDSSFISQESDFVLILWRDYVKQKSDSSNFQFNKYKKSEKREELIYTDESVLALEKNRFNGKLGIIHLQMKDGLFNELTTNYDDNGN